LSPRLTFLLVCFAFGLLGTGWTLCSAWACSKVAETAAFWLMLLLSASNRGGCANLHFLLAQLEPRLHGLWVGGASVHVMVNTIMPQLSSCCRCCCFVATVVLYIHVLYVQSTAALLLFLPSELWGVKSQGGVPEKSLTVMKLALPARQN
jgi:tryptophan-rich sensory protein